MKIMKKTISIAMFTLLLAINGLEATETRSMGLGLTRQTAINPITTMPVDPVDHFWMVDRQLPYIFENPAAVSQFGQFIYGETDGANKNQGGVMLQPLNNINIGLFTGVPVDGNILDLIYPASGSGSPITDSAVGYGMFERLLSHNLVTIIQMNMGKMSLGGELLYGRTGMEETDANTTTTTKLGTSHFQVILGAAMDLGGMNFDGSASLSSYNVTNEISSAATTISHTTSGLGSIDVKARISKAMGKSQLHANLGFGLPGLKVTDNATGGTSSTKETSGMILRAGLSDEIKINENVLIFAGIDFLRQGLTTKTTGIQDVNNTQMQLPFIAGVELQMSESWKGRFGIKNMMLNYLKNENPNTKFTTSNANDSASDFFSGVSVKLSDVSLDWSLNKSFLTLSGGVVATAVATQFGASYYFK